MTQNSSWRDEAIDFLRDNWIPTAFTIVIGLATAAAIVETKDEPECLHDTCATTFVSVPDGNGGVRLSPMMTCSCSEYAVSDGGAE